MFLISDNPYVKGFILPVHACVQNVATNNRFDVAQDLDRWWCFFGCVEGHIQILKNNTKLFYKVIHI